MKKINITKTKIYRTHSNDATLDCRNHTSRKNYQCTNCKNIIEKGNKYTKTVEIIDGYFLSSPWHTECHESYLQLRKNKTKT